ncbi:M23 family metallopeptidase [Vibrio sp. FF145]|uniref:M23 family metallopeptidase n=1 Tax=Vibrio sp. FF145 TaxID=3230013 RepID=UPI00352DC1AA
MEISKKVIVIITLTILPLVFLGSKVLTDTKQRLVDEELNLVRPILEGIAENLKEPYRFPLDSRSELQGFASFNTASRFPHLYHAAIDYFAEVGEPVYAIADGVVSYSGYMNGYPGVVIIDHPKENLYSLYGHLSLKSWLVSKGAIKKGDLLGYIADPSEDFGIGVNAHIHFSIRMGSRMGYPETGPDRWMGGYTTEPPIFKGYIDPEQFILLTKSKLSRN